MSPICLCVLPLQTSIGIISIFPIFYLINANLLSNLKFSILFVTTRKSPSKVGSRPLVSFVVAHRTHSEGTLVIGIIITHSTISSNSLLCSYYDLRRNTIRTGPSGRKTGRFPGNEGRREQFHQQQHGGSSRFRLRLHVALVREPQVYPFWGVPANKTRPAVQQHQGQFSLIYNYN